MTTWHWIPVTQRGNANSVVRGAKRRNASPPGEREATWGFGIGVFSMEDG